MTDDAFVAEAAERSGAAILVARQATLATLDTLGERLSAGDAAALAEILPGELRRFVCRRENPGDFDIDDLYDRVAQRTGLPPGQARELSQVVLRLVGDRLSGDACARLSLHLPAPWRALLERSPTAAAAGALSRHVLPGTGHTLATGRPGSQHPLSQAHPDRAQQESVARSDNPHGEDKLSSAGKDAASDPVATAHPNAGRSLADWKGAK